MANTLEKWFEGKRMTPFRDFDQLRDLQNSFDRVLSDLLDSKKLSKIEAADFHPSCEVTENNNSYMLKFDLPGVTKDQVKVAVDKDRLTVSAERKEEKHDETGKKVFSEIFYGSYSRTFTLPNPVDEKLVEAKFSNGVLTVKIPKTKSVEAKQIPVN